MFGVLQAIFSFAIGVATTLIGYNISRELHSAAITGVMRAPMSFFDTTPLGRIMNRFSKDIDTIDNTLNDSFRMFVSTLAGVVGSVVLIAIVQPCACTFPFLPFFELCADSDLALRRVPPRRRRRALPLRVRRPVLPSEVRALPPGSPSYRR